MKTKLILAIIIFALIAAGMEIGGIALPQAYFFLGSMFGAYITFVQTRGNDETDNL